MAEEVFLEKAELRGMLSTSAKRSAGAHHRLHYIRMVTLPESASFWRRIGTH